MKYILVISHLKGGVGYISTAFNFFGEMFRENKKPVGTVSQKIKSLVNKVQP
jgi:hypothetical protein